MHLSQCRSCRTAASRRGVVAVLVAVSLLILVGALAFAVDGGYLYEKKHLVTAAAEASAGAAATTLFQKYDAWKGADPEGVATRVAQEYAQANGFAAGANTKVQVNIPPKSGSNAGTPGYVEVIITHKVPSTFCTIFSREPVTVTGRAVAAGAYVPTRASVLVLDPKSKNVVSIKGASLTLAGDLMINSKDKKAVQVDKKGQLQADNVMVVGGIDRKQRNNLQLDGDLTTGVKPAADPLQGLAIPSQGTQYDIADLMTTINGVQAYQLKPGYYPKKLEFKDDAVVTFAPGTYTFGDEVRFKDQTTVQGSGVTLYMESKKSLKFETKGSVSLSPPSQGPYAGVTIFLDPGSKGKVEFRKDSNLAVSGTIYAPSGEIRFQQVDAQLGFVDDSTDDESDMTSDPSDWVNQSQGSINAQLIAGKLKIDKKSHINIRGDGLMIDAPLLGIVE